MRMIQTSYSVIAGLLLCCASTSAFSATSGHPLPWPKTFVGQADFDYMREDVLNEYRKKKGLEAERYIATFGGMMKGREIDPFVPKPITTDIGRSKYSKEVFDQRFGLKDGPREFREVYPDIKKGTGLELTLNDGTTAKAELISDTTASLLDSKRVVTIQVNADGNVIEKRAFEKTISETFDNLFLSGTDLKKKAEAENESKETLEEAPKEEDLSAFRISVDLLKDIEEISEDDREQLGNFASFIQNVITQATKQQQAQVSEDNFRQYLGNIVLQSIVASPFKYAIINGKRYQVGGRIPLNVKVDNDEINIEEVQKIIQAYMPKKDSVEEATYKSYEALKEEALKQYTDRLKAETDEDEVAKKIIYAVIEKIESRRVMISLLGEQYILDIKFTL